ncbi:hypothetical protein [Stenotrophomonas sp. GZD-301]|uniref:hypothetical protein n=1 Tax=Stenotrophomonas sp. GZD-301 TaxID=3404814 RepID=UPI003BB65726
MGSKIVIVRLEEPDADVEYSALQVTSAGAAGQADDYAFQLISDWAGDRLKCETQEGLEELLADKNFRAADADAATVDAWDEYAKSFGNNDEKQVEVTTHYSESIDGSFIVRRVSFLDRGVWVEPKTRFVVLPRFGAVVVGVYSDPARAVAEAEASAQDRKELAGAARDRTTGYNGS